MRSIVMLRGLLTCPQENFEKIDVLRLNLKVFQNHNISYIIYIYFKSQNNHEMKSQESSLTNYQLWHGNIYGIATEGKTFIISRVAI